MFLSETPLPKRGVFVCLYSDRRAEPPSQAILLRRAEGRLRRRSCFGVPKAAFAGDPASACRRPPSQRFGVLKAAIDIFGKKI